ncbi:MAG: hypothetical protein HGB01_06935 [Chlorobiaceae bacterium]|nr:hypothetical protein [Chlorobiaceae bacterium]
MKNIDIKAADLAKKLTIRVSVSGMNVLRARFSVGAWIMRLAAKIMGVTIILIDSRHIPTECPICGSVMKSESNAIIPPGDE